VNLEVPIVVNPERATRIRILQRAHEALHLGGQVSLPLRLKNRSRALPVMLNRSRSLGCLLWRPLRVPNHSGRAALCGPVEAVLEMVGSAAPDLCGRGIGRNAVAPQLICKPLPPTSEIRLADIESSTLPPMCADD